MLVNPNDFQGFALAIAQLLNDKERIERMGREAREHVLKLDWERIVKLELEAINNLKLKEQSEEIQT